MTVKEEAQKLFDKFDYLLYKEYDNLEAKKMSIIAVEYALEKLDTLDPKRDRLYMIIEELKRL